MFHDVQDGEAVVFHLPVLSAGDLGPCQHQPSSGDLLSHGNRPNTLAGCVKVTLIVTYIVAGHQKGLLVGS